MESDLTKEKSRVELKLEEAQRRHQGELKNEKERLRIEQDEWKAEFIRKQKDQMQDY